MQETFGNKFRSKNMSTNPHNITLPNDRNVNVKIADTKRLCPSSEIIAFFTLSEKWRCGSKWGTNFYHMPFECMMLQCDEIALQFSNKSAEPAAHVMHKSCAHKRFQCYIEEKKDEAMEGAVEGA